LKHTLEALRALLRHIEHELKSALAAQGTAAVLNRDGLFVGVPDCVLHGFVAPNLLLAAAKCDNSYEATNFQCNFARIEEL
jgi:hypothetical protein